MDQDDLINDSQLEQAYEQIKKQQENLGFDDLKKLADESTPEDLRRLHQLADDHDIHYDDSTDLMELVEKIHAAISKDPKISLS